jgi:hypothetical protein
VVTANAAMARAVKSVFFIVLVLFCFVVFSILLIFCDCEVKFFRMLLIVQARCGGCFYEGLWVIASRVVFLNSRKYAHSHEKRHHLYCNKFVT